ncbi:MAG: RHS repeat-associated core domain-containing protein [Bacteroidales bacterium]|nr:RHS repeat-associated core domain-containing protein [Bacteroidales bacterium]
MTTKNDIQKATSKQPQNVAGNSVFCHSAFTGKELDLETGYSYFGARYLDNALSTAWLSVDPMSDKYPSISPYAYCSWNPVKLVDPDGKRIKLHDRTTHKYVKKYLNELFGKSNMFSFTNNNYLQINNRRYKRYYKNASPDQRKLLDGIRCAIEAKEIALLRVTENYSGDVEFTMKEFEGLDDNENPKYKETNSCIYSDGGSGYTATSPMDGTIGVVYPVLINDKGTDQQNLLSTDLYTLGGGESDILFPIYTTTTASSVFIHEILDEFLNRNIRHSVTESSSGKEKVDYQNAALRILGRYERNGKEHYY